MRRFSEFLADETAAIFLFHGVIGKPAAGIRNSVHKHLTLGEFDSVLDDLLAHGRPVTMDDLAAGGDLPPAAFAVTFDDGFRNNLTVAAPVLERRSVPATFYVTSDFVTENGASWIDRIEYAFSIRDTFDLVLPFGRRSCTAGGEKLALLAEIRTYVKGGAADPYVFAGDVWAQLGVETMEPDAELDAKLTWDEVRALTANPLFTVGGHGKTHRILGHLAEAELHLEIDESIATLTAELGTPPRHYSYPEGQRGCYSERVIELLRAHGVVCAPTAETGVNRCGDDPFLLKRIQVD